MDKSDQELLTGSARTGVKVGLSAGSHHHLDLSQTAAHLHHWTAVRIIRSELSQSFRQEVYGYEILQSIHC